MANSLGFSRLNGKENREQGKAIYGQSFSLTRHLCRGYHRGVTHYVKIRKFKMLYFQNEKRYGTGNFEKDLSLGQLHPTGIYKNSEDFDYRVW